MVRSNDAVLNVLFVDDEPRALEVMKRLSSDERDHWAAQFATSGSQAVELLAGQHFDVVVTDLQMPGMDGVELLWQSKEISPATVRVALSEQARRSTSLRAAAVAHQLLPKPAEPLSIRQTVNRAGRLSRLISRPQLRSALGGIDSLPSPPRTIQSLNAALADPDSEVAAIAEIVEGDMGLASKVLQLVNSAYFGLRREVTGIRQAVTYIGRDNLRNLVTSVEVFKSFPKPNFEGDLAHELQQHGLLVGRVAQHLLCDRRAAAQLFVPSLMHDLGLLAIASLDHAGWADLASDPSAWTLERETQVVGANHAEIGAYLLTLWGFPLEAADAVALHHEPPIFCRGDVFLTDAIQIAELLAADAFDLVGHAGWAGSDILEQSCPPDLLEEWRTLVAQFAAAA